MKKKKVRIYKKPNQMQEPMYNIGGKMYSEPELIGMYPEAYKQYQMAYGGSIPQHGFGEWLGKNAGTIGAVVGGVGGFLVGGPAGAAAGAKLGGMAGGKLQSNYEQKQADQLAAEQAALQPDMNTGMQEQACNCEEPRREAAATNTFAMGGSLKCMKCGGKTHYPDGGIITTTDSKGNIMLGRTKDTRSSSGKGYNLQGLVFNPNTGQIGVRAELNNNSHYNNKFNQGFIEAGKSPEGAYGDFGFKTGKGGDFYLGNKKLNGNAYISGNIGSNPNITYGGAGIGGNILIPIGKKGLNLFGQGDLGFKYSQEGNYDSGKSTKLDGGVTAGIRYKFENGGAIQNPQYEAEGGEVIQADGMQIHGGGNNPNLDYYTEGAAIIKGADHAEDSDDPKSGVKMSSSGSTDGRIFSKRLKNPATKKPFAEDADKLLKKVSKYDKVLKDKNSEAIARKTAQIMSDKYNALLDELFETQEEFKSANNIGNSGMDANEAVGAAKAESMNALPEGAPTQDMLNIMQQQMAGIPAEQAVPNIPMQAYGGYAGRSGSYVNSLESLYANPEMPRAKDRDRGEQNIVQKKEKEVFDESAQNNMNDIAQEIGKSILTTAITGGLPVGKNGGKIMPSTIYKYGGAMKKAEKDSLGILKMMAKGGKLPQFEDGKLLTGFGEGIGATASVPTTIFDLVNGYKNPYEWQQIQNQQQANALGMYDDAKAGLGDMGSAIQNMDATAKTDFQTARDLYKGLGDLDVSQQRADVKSAAGTQMDTLRGGAGSRQEMLAGAQNIYGGQQAQLGQVEAYKNKFDAEQERLKAAGLAGLGSAEGSLQAQKAGLLGSRAGMLGQLGGMYNQLGQQEREYMQYLSELNKAERDLKTAQKRSGFAGIGNFLADTGSALIGMGIGQS